LSQTPQNSRKREDEIGNRLPQKPQKLAQEKLTA